MNTDFSKKSIFVLSALFLLSSGQVFSKTKAKKAIKKKKAVSVLKAPKKKADSFSLYYRHTVSRKLYIDDGKAKAYGGNNEFSFTYKLPIGHKINVYTTYARPWSGVEGEAAEGKLGDTSIKYSMPFGKLAENATIGGDFMVGLPTSESSNKSASLNNSIKARLPMSFDMAPFGMKGLSIFYRPQVTLYNHSYTTSASGDSNTRTAVGHLLNFGYSLGNFSASIGGFYGNSWTYDGTMKADSISIYQEVAYNLEWLADTGVLLGHSNDGSLYNQDPTEDYVFGLTNDKQSSVYFQIYKTFTF
jgi:hypothetical protein